MEGGKENLDFQHPYSPAYEALQNSLYHIPHPPPAQTVPQKKHWRENILSVTFNSITQRLTPEVLQHQAFHLHAQGSKRIMYNVHICNSFT